MDLGIGVLHIIGDGKYFGRINTVPASIEQAVDSPNTDLVVVEGAVDTITAPLSRCVVSGIDKPNPGGVVDLQPI